MDLLSHELLRKAFHVTGSVIPVAYYFLSRETALVLLSLLNFILLLIEWLRLQGKIKIPKILLRRHEETRVAAYIYFQIGAFASILMFQKTIAIAALLMLAIGDTASGIAGAITKKGNVRHSGKNTVKSAPIIAAMFLTCLLVGLVLLSLPPANDMRYLPFGIYVAGALGATLGDAVPIKIMGKPVDDNLTIPLLAGAFMTAAIFI